MLSKNRQNRKINFEILKLEKGETCSNHYKNCEKQLGHRNYIMPKDLQIESLHNKDKLLYDLIKLRCALTGLIKITPCDGDKENTEVCDYFGTGFVQRVDADQTGPCPCPICERCEHQKDMPWAKILISTAFHVVEEKGPQDTCTVDLFYHEDIAEPSEDTKLLYGNKVHSIDKEGDWCVLECVTHNIHMINCLERAISLHYEHGSQLQEKYGDDKTLNEPPVVVISHPHGMAKRVSIGKLIQKEVNKEVRDEQEFANYYYDATTCPGSSGGSVYILGKWIDGFGYWFGHPHSHSGVDSLDNTGKSSVGAEAATSYN